MPPKVKFKKEAIIDAAFNVVRKMAGRSFPPALLQKS